MFQRAHIEKLLALNGVDVSSSDDEIKSVLLSARWHKDHVEAAVLVLRENKVTHQTHVDSLQRVFRSDERLRPETVGALLGIEMEVTADERASNRSAYTGRGLSPGQMMTIAIVALVLSLVFVFAAMWALEMGFFHYSVRS